MSASSAPGGALCVRAHAKINVYLEVRGRRPDGYHELVTAMQAIGIADTLICAARHDRLLTLTVDPPDPRLVGDDNLVLRAARLLRDRAGGTRGADLFLRKRIPIAAGLGGGSADAAATLYGLDQLWGVGCPTEALHDLAGRLGSDVPFFSHRAGLATCRGRGERVEPEGGPPDRRTLLLVVPEIAVSTRDVYDALVAEDLAIRRPRNALQPAAERLFPAIAEHRRKLDELTGFPFHMSGSGPTLFAWTHDYAAAERYGTILRRSGYRCFVTQAVSKSLTSRWVRR